MGSVIHLTIKPRRSPSLLDVRKAVYQDLAYHLPESHLAFGLLDVICDVLRWKPQLEEQWQENGSLPSYKELTQLIHYEDIPVTLAGQILRFITMLPSACLDGELMLTEYQSLCITIQRYCYIPNTHNKKLEH